MPHLLKSVLAAGLIWTAAAKAESPAPITLNGLTFGFRAIQPINNGWGSYYTPDGQEPDRSRDEIIINYLNAKTAAGEVITPDGMASAMLENTKSRGGTVILPFAVPDPARQGELNFYMVFFYVYPQDGNGDVWMSKVTKQGDRVVGLLLKHQIEGANAEDIDAKIRKWLIDKLQSQSPGLDQLAIPPEPPHG